MTRSAEIKAERRRRDGPRASRGKLAVDESLLDRKKYAYRWINDEGTRVQDLTVSDDWEIVPDMESGGRATGKTVSVGRTKESDAGKAVLVRKLKEYYDEDKGAEQREIDEKERGLVKADKDGHYVPKGGSSIRSDART